MRASCIYCFENRPMLLDRRHRVEDTGRGPRPRLRLIVAAAAATIAVVIFLTIDLNGYWQYILPRRITKLAAILLTAYAIGVATVIFQTITGNRILTPALMGFDSLYILLQTTLTFVFTAGRVAALDPSLRFSLETAVMVVLATLLFRWLFLGRQLSLHQVLLVGIIFGTVFRSLSSFLQRLMDPSEFVVLQDMFFASFNSVSPRLLLLSAVLVGIVSVPLIRMVHKLDVLALGRDLAINLGVDHRRAVTEILIIVTVLVSVSTALVGPITFFGLLVANLAYLVSGTNRHAVTLPMAAALAVVTLVGGQLVLERIFDFNTSLSVVVEFLGGVVFLMILVRNARKGVNL